jgi:hypothetical protein
MRHRHAALSLAALLLAAACSSSSSNQANPAPAAQARVSIDNRSSLDVDIFVHQQRGITARLGFAPANEVTTFALAPGLIAGAGTIVFEARPVRGGGEPVTSDPFDVRSGEEISWSIPPQ